MFKSDSSRMRDAVVVSCYLGIGLVTVLPAVAVGQEITVINASGSALYRSDVEEIFHAKSHVVTSLPSTFTGANVAPLVGADTFYNHGYTGQGTVTVNIEAGHIWSGHESLQHVATFYNDVNAPGSGFAKPAYDMHATWVGQTIGGRPTFAGDNVSSGIAPGTTLQSGAVATSWTDALSFSLSWQTLAVPYAAAFGNADVINSSWGADSPTGSANAAGTSMLVMVLDAMANENPRTTLVVSTGNSGQTANPLVGAPASGYNAISVGALANDGSNNYNTVAGFSSRGATNYGDSVNGIISASTARRAAVDIVAPGDTLTLAFYGGTSGGNDASIGGSSYGSGPNAYVPNLQGTSFAAPIVAGSASLMHNAADSLNLSADAHDTRVIKANMMNAARKIAGWSNGQSAHPNGNGGVVTTDALDMNSGAGALDMNRTWTQYTQGQTDIAGTNGGTTNSPIGWDFASVGIGSHTDVVINQILSGEFRATLSWFRERDYISAGSQLDVGYANLDLQVWDSTFTTLIAESISLYTETEHLAFNLPEQGMYGLRVVYDDNVFGTLNNEEFGLAWWAVAVPEPTGLMLLIPAMAMTLRRRR